MVEQAFGCEKMLNECLEEELFMAEVKYEILEQLGIISVGEKSWKKELNIISWNEREPKYDLREWSEGHDKMGKGVTFTKDELENLKELLNKIL